MKQKIINNCSRCGHIWKQRKKIKPKICPICKSKYWDEGVNISDLLISKKL